MGGCWQSIFKKQNIIIKQSRINLLSSKIQAKYHTQNDINFTYYLRSFELRQYLQKYLQQSKQGSSNADTHTTNNRIQQLQSQLKYLQKYLQNFNNNESELSKRIKLDEQKIQKYIKQTKKQQIQIQISQFCMVKFQLQDYQIINNIKQIRIKSYELDSQSIKQEVISILKNKNTNIYREYVFKSIKYSKIQITTLPLISNLTIDVQDISKHQVVCQNFKLQAKDQEYGIIALRLQFISNKKQTKKIINKNLKLLQKQLKMCKSGSNWQDISNIHSQNSSVRQTFISQHVSQYMNQYQV